MLKSATLCTWLSLAVMSLGLGACDPLKCPESKDEKPYCPAPCSLLSRRVVVGHDDICNYYRTVYMCFGPSGGACPGGSVDMSTSGAPDMSTSGAPDMGAGG